MVSTIFERDFLNTKCTKKEINAHERKQMIEIMNYRVRKVTKAHNDSKTLRKISQYINLKTIQTTVEVFDC